MHIFNEYFIYGNAVLCYENGDFLLSIFNNQAFKQRHGCIHKGGKDAKDKYRAHYQIQLKHLPAVDDQVSNARFGNDVFTHNRPYPRHTDVDFQHRDEIG